MVDLKLTAIAAVIGLAVGAGGGWAIKGWQADAELAKTHQSHADVLRGIAEKTRQAQAAANRAGEAFMTAMATADTVATNRISHAENETQQLRDCIAAGTCGVRIITRTTPSRSSDVPNTAAASCVGDATEPLDEDVSSRVLDHRESIQHDAAKIEYLQSYADKCWRIGVAPAN